MDTVDQFEVQNCIRHMSRKAQALARQLMDGLSRRKARAKLGISEWALQVRLAEIRAALTAAGFAQDFCGDPTRIRRLTPPNRLWQHGKAWGGFAVGRMGGKEY